jgi:hypothetical protein
VSVSPSPMAWWRSVAPPDSHVDTEIDFHGLHRLGAVRHVIEFSLNDRGYSHGMEPNPLN